MVLPYFEEILRQIRNLKEFYWHCCWKIDQIFAALVSKEAGWKKLRLTLNSAVGSKKSVILIQWSTTYILLNILHTLLEDLKSFALFQYFVIFLVWFRYSLQLDQQVIYSLKVISFLKYWIAKIFVKSEKIPHTWKTVRFFYFPPISQFFSFFLGCFLPILDYLYKETYTDTRAESSKSTNSSKNTK